MHRFGKVYLLAIIVLLIGAAYPAAAEIQTILTLDNIPAGMQTYDVWQENGADLWFGESTVDDYYGGVASSFYYEPAGNEFAGEVWLFPARLVIDLGISMIVHRVEIDWMDNCDYGCTEAFLYNQDVVVGQISNTVLWENETVSVSPTGGVADSIVIASSEGAVMEIRIYTDVVETGSSAWSEIKSIYR